MSIHSVRTVIVCACLSMVLLTACSVYRPEIHQGQTLKQKDVDRVTAGMSPQEVRDILGTPLVTDVFSSSRWDYVYSAFDRERNQTDLARVTVFFADGVVEQVVSDSEMPQKTRHLENTPERSKKGLFSSIRQWSSDFASRFKRQGETDDADEKVENNSSE